jgi:soluble lytic murein transglycosylase
VLRLFHDDIPLALAAYNAGTHRVRQWLERSGERPLDLFVEEIPFDETRNYVRRVTSHLIAYRYIEDPAHGWELSLPASVAPAATGE